MQFPRLVSIFFAVAALAALTPAASGQTTAGAGSVVIIPQVASLATYVTTVFVRNPSSTTDITLNVKYYISNATGTPPLTPKPWLVTCSSLSVPKNQVATFDLATQCPPIIGGVTIADNFGMLVLEDAASPKVNVFSAYTRVQVPSAIGFSMEGFPIGNFSAALADVIGLQRTATGAKYLSNCFVGSLGEGVDVQIELRTGANALLGATQVSLGPWETIRLTDIFAQVGLATGDFNNVRATFTNIGTGQALGAAFIPFCTMESRVNSSADFRIAKSIDANDQRQSRKACYGQSQCGTVVGAIDKATVPNASTRNIHYTIFDQPDFVQCSLVYKAGDPTGTLEIMVRGPGSPTSTTPFVLPAPYTGAPFTAGGASAQSFYIYTGERSTQAGGLSTRWYIDVQIDPLSGAAGPVDYGITCTSGNGVTIPWMGMTSGATP